MAGRAGGSADLGRRLGRQAEQSRADAALPIARSVSARQAWRAGAGRRGAASRGGRGVPAPARPRAPTLGPARSSKGWLTRHLGAAASPGNPRGTARSETQAARPQAHGQALLRKAFENKRCAFTKGTVQNIHTTNLWVVG